jgi:hypothetical protein
LSVLFEALETEELGPDRFLMIRTGEARRIGELQPTSFTARRSSENRDRPAVEMTKP